MATTSLARPILAAGCRPAAVRALTHGLLARDISETAGHLPSRAISTETTTCTLVSKFRTDFFRCRIQRASGTAGTYVYPVTCTYVQPKVLSSSWRADWAPQPEAARRLDLALWVGLETGGQSKAGLVSGTTATRQGGGPGRSPGGLIARVMTALRSVGTRRRGNAIDYPRMTGYGSSPIALLFNGIRLPWYAGITGQGCSGSCYIMWESRKGTSAVRGFGGRSFADGCIFWSFAW